MTVIVLLTRSKNLGFFLSVLLYFLYTVPNRIYTDPNRIKSNTINSLIFTPCCTAKINNYKHVCIIKTFLEVSFLTCISAGGP